MKKDLRRYARPFEIVTPAELEPVYTEEKMVALAEQYGDHLADWVEQALEFAQKLLMVKISSINQMIQNGLERFHGRTVMCVLLVVRRNLIIMIVLQLFMNFMLILLSAT